MIASPCERVKRAIGFQPTDRVPRGELLVDNDFLNHLYPGKVERTHREKMERLVEEAQLDLVVISLDRRSGDEKWTDLEWWVGKTDRFIVALLDGLFCLRMKILPLRERKDEIPQLVDRFIALFNREQNRSVLGITRDSLGSLLKYDWPDNVRELRMEIERAATLTGDYQSIKPEVLSERVTQSVSNVRSLN